MCRKFRRGFPYQYEVLDCIDGFDFRDPHLATFCDVVSLCTNAWDYEEIYLDGENEA